MENEITKSEKNEAVKFDNGQIQLIHDLYAKNTTKEEFELYLYTAGKYNLDPLLKQIWCVKYEGQPAQIYSGRDGFLEIAHRSNFFDGIESGTRYDERNNLIGWCKVYRKDMKHFFYVEVDFKEYSTGKALWLSKQKTMIIKVAESQCLRRAFRISNIYSEEEMGQWELQAQGIEFNNEQEKEQPQQEKQDFDWSKLDLTKAPKWGLKDGKRSAPPIIKRLFAISKKYKILQADFKEICQNATGKEHSYMWTYGDIKAIEENIYKAFNSEVVVAPVVEDVVEDVVAAGVEELSNEEYKAFKEKE